MKKQRTPSDETLLIDSAEDSSNNPPMIAKYLDPKNDFTFKKIFGNHANLLKSFLNAVLPLPEDCMIESLTYLPPESVPEIKGFKSTIVDVRCCDNHGRHFIVEMQIQWTKHFVQRMLFNTASIYSRQLKQGQDYSHLSPVYGLALVNDNFTKGEEWYHHFQMTDKNNRALEDIQLVLIELPNFKPSSIAFRKLAVLWLRFFKETDEQTRTVDESLLAEEPIKEAFHLLEAAAYTESELRTYDKFWDIIRTGKTYINDKVAEAEEQGMAKGMAEGMAKGLAEGEMKAKAAMIRKMHDSHFSTSEIARFTELSEEQVKALLEKQL